MTKIIICDDEDKERNLLLELVNQYIKSANISNVKILSFSSPHIVLAEEVADIYLLDIIMPQLNGVDLCKKIREKNPDAKVIFCTTSKEFAIDAFNLRVVHYLLKPIQKEQLFNVLSEILVSKAQNMIGITTKDGIVAININDIAYVEYDNHQLKYCLNNKKFIVSVVSRKSFLIEAENLIKENFFLQTHNAYLVNICNVKKYNTDSFELMNGSVVPIAKLKRATIKEQYLKFLSSYGGLK